MNIEDLKCCGNCQDCDRNLKKFICNNEKSPRYKEEFYYADRYCDEWTWDKIYQACRIK